jgi:hypothetical protein
LLTRRSKCYGRNFLFFKIRLTCLLGVQWGSVLAFLTVEWAMVDYYKLGTFENPESILDKITNFFMKLFLAQDTFFIKSLLNIIGS